MVVPVVAIVAVAVAMWWSGRRRKALLAAQKQARDAEASEQVFDRRMLVGRPSATFDPDAWQNTPDPVSAKKPKPARKQAPAPQAPSARPTPAPFAAPEAGFVLDRAFLEARQRQKADEGRSVDSSQESTPS